MEECRRASPLYAGPGIGGGGDLIGLRSQPPFIGGTSERKRTVQLFHGAPFWSRDAFCQSRAISEVRADTRRSRSRGVARVRGHHASAEAARASSRAATRSRRRRDRGRGGTLPRRRAPLRDDLLQRGVSRCGPKIQLRCWRLPPANLSLRVWQGSSSWRRYSPPGSYPPWRIALFAANTAIQSSSAVPL